MRPWLLLVLFLDGSGAAQAVWAGHASRAECEQAKVEVVRRVHPTPVLMRCYRLEAL